ncbi:hypothetical protein [Mycolicibacterium porcinum]|uniref:hypothetical protein n=1 Tax=Mycolicibacterium porcinum TaxID=39693 RepID=UPI00256EC3B8|nr:hypothetical protein [Mycolicibacterium porcinum]
MQPIDLSDSPVFLDAQQQVMEMLLAATPDDVRDGRGRLAALTTLRVLVRWVAKTIDYARLEHEAVLASCGPERLNRLAPCAAGHGDCNTVAETAASIATALTILNARNITETTQIWRDLMIAATCGRLHRLTESDQNALIPFIRSAYSRAFDDANAQLKLCRHFTTSAAKHQLRLLRQADGGERLRRANQHCAR